MCAPESEKRNNSQSQKCLGTGKATSVANLMQGFVFFLLSYDFKKLQMEYIFVLLFYLDRFRKTQRLNTDIFIKNITALCQKQLLGKWEDGV